MNVNDLISDVGLLCGLTLKSIRPGAEITILCVDAEKGNLILRTKSGENKSRPLSELVFLQNELQRKPAVHVDEALHGSGTSRNQPETILANLPYIEWLKIDGKKHIAYVGKRTHPFGTLQKMSAAETVKTMEAMHNTEVTPNSVIVDYDVNSVIHMLQRVSERLHEPTVKEANKAEIKTVARESILERLKMKQGQIGGDPSGVQKKKKNRDQER